MKAFLLAALILAPIGAHAGDIKKVSGADLAVQTHKWDGRTIETTGSCFYADVNEFRCMSGSLYDAGARIDFKKIEPEAARKNLMDHCDTLASLTSKACRVRFQFVYESFTTHQSGAVVSHIVTAKGDAGTIVGK